MVAILLKVGIICQLSVVLSHADFLVRAGGLGLCRSGFNRLAIKISNQRTTTINPDFSTCDETGGI